MIVIRREEERWHRRGEVSASGEMGVIGTQSTVYLFADLILIGFLSRIGIGASNTIALIATLNAAYSQWY